MRDPRSRGGLNWSGHRDGAPTPDKSELVARLIELGTILRGETPPRIMKEAWNIAGGQLFAEIERICRDLGYVDGRLDDGDVKGSIRQYFKPGELLRLNPKIEGVWLNLSEIADSKSLDMKVTVWLDPNFATDDDLQSLDRKLECIPSVRRQHLPDEANLKGGAVLLEFDQIDMNKIPAAFGAILERL